MKLARSVFCAFVAMAIAGCGSAGGGPVNPGQPAPTGPGPQSATRVYFSVTIPNQSTQSSTGRLTRGHIRPQYISTNTQSLALTVNSEPVQLFALTPSSNANCSVNAGATTCSNLVATAPPGTDSFTFTMYSNALPLPPTPTALSTVTVGGKVIQEGVANQLGYFTLNPILGSVALSVTSPVGGFAAGTSATGLALAVSTKDPSGATIIAPGIYVNASGTATPIGLSTNWTTSPNDAVWAFSVDGGAYAATGSLTQPSDTADLSYTGSSVPATTITAAAGAISASQVVSVSFAPIKATLSSAASGSDYLVTTAPPELDFYESGITGTVALSETGYAGTFTLQSSTCNSSEVGFSPAVGGTGTSFTVSALAGGTAGTPAICTATFADTNSQTLAVTFSVTTIGFGLQ